jgi:S-adenosylmethionine uptake transporter
MYFLARAYSVALASVVAPFEYMALPIHIMWGLILWHEVPTWMTLAGASLALLSGLYVLYRERRERPVVEQIEGKRAGWKEEVGDEP